MGQIPSGKNAPSLDQTSQAYLKNILLKYLEYNAHGEDKQSMMMEKVLFTILKVEQKDIKQLSEARLKSYNSGFTSYFWSLELDSVVAKPVQPRAYNPGDNK